MKEKPLINMKKYKEGAKWDLKHQRDTINIYFYTHTNEWTIYRCHKGKVSN